MGVCELCGKKTDKMYKIRVAGTILSVCENCKGMGIIVEEPKEVVEEKHFYEPKKPVKKFVKKSIDEEELDILDNFQSIISKALAEKELNIHNLARAINIKESTLSKMLSKKIKMDLKTAKKLEKFLDVKITGKKEIFDDEEDFNIDDVLI